MNAPAPKSAEVNLTASIPCIDAPDSWDIDAGTYESGIAAQAKCLLCPQLQECRRSLNALIAAKTPPYSVIWAGIPFSDRGRVILTDRQIRSQYRRAERDRLDDEHTTQDQVAA